jgi:hypothetical protein
MDHPAMRPFGSSPRVRLVNAALGAWLFVSAFLWPHVGAIAFSTWLTGLLVAASALMAIWAPAARWLTTILAVWLLLTAVFFPHASGLTAIHDGLVAIAMFVVSLVPARSAAAPERVPA